jgi:RNA polymerase sigma-70 factor (ECF subfamily)
MNEEKLIRQCAKANRKAQRELYENTYSSSFYLALRYLGNHHDAEDVLTDSYTRIFQKIKAFEYRGKGSLKRWINTLVINECLRYLKRRKLLVFDEDLIMNVEVPDDLFDSCEIDLVQIKTILEKMPAGYRTVFNLFAIEGFSHKEISEIMGISESTSRSQLAKARKYIIERLNYSVNYENK